MIPAEFDFIGDNAMVAATDYRQEMTLYDGVGDVVDLSASDVRMDIKNAAGDVIITFNSEAPQSNITLSDTAPNIILAETPANTDLTPGIYAYDMRIKDVDGQQIYISGRYQIEPSITPAIV